MWGGRNGQGVVRRSLLSRGERWVNRRLSYASSSSLGLNVKGLRGFHVIFFFFFEGRQAEVHCGISSQIGRLVLLRPIIPDS